MKLGEDFVIIGLIFRDHEGIVLVALARRLHERLNPKTVELLAS